jgi:hypothetical protein
MRYEVEIRVKRIDENKREHSRSLKADFDFGSNPRWAHGGEISVIDQTAAYLKKAIAAEAKGTDGAFPLNEASGTPRML